MPADSALQDAAKLLDQGKYVDAAKQFAAIAKSNPALADAWRGLGIANLRLQDVGRAHDLFKVALSRAPQQYENRYYYASTLGLLGRFDEAQAELLRVIDQKPDLAQAYFALSRYCKFTDETVLERIEAQIAAGKKPGDTDLLHFHFAAGKICDDLKQYDRAFRHYRLGNKARRANYQIQNDLAFFTKLERVFTEDFLDAPAEDPKRGAGQVFIIGMPRSGTTLLEEMLSRHPQITGVGERTDVHDITVALRKHSSIDAAYPECVAGLPPDAFRGFGTAYIQAMNKRTGNAPVVVNKHPLNFWNVGLIRKLLPGATILHARRHPLDICLSCYFQNFEGGQRYSFDLKTLGRFYNLYEKTCDLWADRIPGFALDVRYDELVGDPEKTLRRVLDRIGLAWHDACLSEAASNRPIQTASSWQARQKVHTHSVGKARHYRHHLAKLEDIIADRIAAYESASQ